MKRILAPTDLSEHARRGIECAAALAKRCGSEIELFTSTFSPALGLSPERLPLSVHRQHEIRETARERLQELAVPLERQGIEVTCRVADTSPVDAICHRAEQAAFDLIAMGTRGLTGLPHAVLGTVAERTVRFAPCPVLTAHADAPPPREPERIMVATDFSPSSEAALIWARSAMAQLGTGTLILFHATDDANVGSARARLRDWIASHEINPQIAFAQGRPAVAILEAAEAERADLLVVGTLGRTGLEHMLLGSVAERVLRQSKLPVVVVRA